MLVAQQTKCIENIILSLPIQALSLKSLKKNLNKVKVTIVEKSKPNPRDNIISVKLLKAYSSQYFHKIFNIIDIEINKFSSIVRFL